MGREEKNQLTREKILNAALNEFGQKDYFTASTNSICKNHDISKGLLFHHYKTKDELFMACVQQCFDALSKYLEECSLITEGNIQDILSAYMSRRIEFFNCYPDYQRIFYTAVLNTPIHLKNQIDESRQSLNHVNQTFLRKVLQTVELKESVDCEQVIRVIIDYGNYIQMKYKDSYITAEEGQLSVMEEHNREFTQLINMIFYGILK